jgi:hypothetical protein
VPLIHSRAEKLNRCIARYEQYLRNVSADLAATYRAEIVAAKALLEESNAPDLIGVSVEQR